MDKQKRKLGEIWKDGSDWIVQFKNCRSNFKTKKEAIAWSNAIDGKENNEYGYTKENIINWFYNYITFYPINKLKNMTVSQIKADFIEGEKKELEHIIKNQNKQIEILNFVILIISNLKIDKKRVEKGFKYLL